VSLPSNNREPNAFRRPTPLIRGPAPPRTAQCISINRLSYSGVRTYPMVMEKGHSISDRSPFVAHPARTNASSIEPLDTGLCAPVGDPPYPFYFLKNPPFLTVLSGASRAPVNALALPCWTPPNTLLLSEESAVFFQHADGRDDGSSSPPPYMFVIGCVRPRHGKAVCAYHRRPLDLARSPRSSTRAIRTEAALSRRAFRLQRQAMPHRTRQN
jgi:hypothetical protein